jgi:hypothetical protein
MATVLVFAFKSGGSQTILQLINAPCVEKRVTRSGIGIFEQFAKELRESDCQAIIGLGMTRRGKYLRLEQTCHNRFKSKTLAEQPTIYQIPNFLPYSKDIHPGNAIGDSYCNAICYQIMRLTQPKHLSYIHIPNGLDSSVAAAIISRSIDASLFSNSFAQKD